MANKKRKQEVELVEEIKGLPYNDLLAKIFDYILLGVGVLCLLSLVIPILRFWYPLGDNPAYTNFFAPGYGLVFGGTFKHIGEKENSRVLTLLTNTRYLLSYIFIVVSLGLVGCGYLKSLKKYKKFLRLGTSFLLVAAFVLIVGYTDALVALVRSYKGITNTIKNGAFTFYGIVFLVSMVIGAGVSFYQACCEKFVKN